MPLIEQHALYKITFVVKDAACGRIRHDRFKGLSLKPGLCGANIDQSVCFCYLVLRYQRRMKPRLGLSTSGISYDPVV